MNTLLSHLSEAVGAAFTACGLPPELGVVKISDRPDLAQFQCNGAMAAAKKMARSPREVAASIVAELQKNEIFTKVEAVGPGFINLNIHDAALTRHLNTFAHDATFAIPQSGAGKTALLDYGGPNAAKPMHVGHLRSGIVGDTLRRLMLASGYNAIGDIHLGDSGLQAGMVISELELRHPEWPYFDPRATTFPATCPVSFDDLGEIYPTASGDSKNDAGRMEKSQAATLKLEQGHAGYKALWSQVIDISIVAMKANYAALNVHFDLWKGEMSVLPLVPAMVADLKARSIAVMSEGAIVVPVARNDDKREFPPLILVKSDGASLYATTDMATLIDRMNMTPRPDRIIYVIDQRQNLHIEQVKRAAFMAKIIPNEEMIDFAGFGTMNGQDGKPFKTRAGGVLKLEDLIASGVEKAKARMIEVGMATDLSGTEQDKIAHQVAVAAIKFADLKNARHVDYIFDLDAMTSFEGKTGPYLLYQAVRIKSLLAKAAAQNLKPGDAITIDDGSRALALLVADFPNAVALSVEALSAHVLCDYLHRLAQEFSSFYGQVHILSEVDAQKQAGWLALCALTYAVLDRGLNLMGIDIPEKM
jgi:arginyl-tRNA synthetase